MRETKCGITNWLMLLPSDLIKSSSNVPTWWRTHFSCGGVVNQYGFKGEIPVLVVLGREHDTDRHAVY